MTSNSEDLKAKLEILLGARAEANIDKTVEAKEREAALAQDRRKRVAVAGGTLLGAAFQFLGELVGGEANGAPPETVVRDLRSRLDQCVEDDGEGRPRLTVTLPDRSALDGLAQTLARILATADAK